MDSWFFWFLLVLYLLVLMLPMPHKIDTMATPIYRCTPYCTINQ